MAEVTFNGSIQHIKSIKRWRIYCLAFLISEIPFLSIQYPLTILVISIFSISLALTVLTLFVCKRTFLQGMRRHLKYRRIWTRFCFVHKLAVIDWQSGHVATPTLKKITTGKYVDYLLVRMLPGQTPDLWVACEESMTHSLAVHSVKTVNQISGQMLIIIQLGKPKSVVNWVSETEAHIEYH